MKNLLAALFFSVAVEAAAQPVPYEPPDHALWLQMVEAIDDVPMSKKARQQIYNILDAVQQQAIKMKQQQGDMAKVPPKPRR